MRILSLLIAVAALLYSCDKKATVDATAVTAADSATTMNVVEANEQVTTEGANTVVTDSDSKKPALNPEHGQPYHRCEIPVGAPIDSAPQQSAAPQVIPQQNASPNNFNTNPISPSVAPAPSAPVQATGPKPANNPAHGQPHHRCDLEVGAPLP